MARASRYIARTSPAWVREGIVYEIYPRAFSPEGTLRAIEKNLPRLRELGVTILWLMPIHPIGAVKRKGSLGSPYAVHDHYAVNPEYGSLDDVRSLVAAAHAHGFHIIMDLVIGHTAWNSVPMQAHPEWYKKDSAGRILSPVPEWSDVAALAYSRKHLRRYMLEMMRFWIGDVGFDGFRCDDAGRVPVSFWETARSELTPLKSLLLISETDTRPSHHRNAFDLTYSTKLCRLLRSVLVERVPAYSLHRVLAAEKLRYPRGSLLLRFSTNHDLNVDLGADAALFGDNGARLAMALVFTLHGVPLLYNGQESGNRKRLTLFHKPTMDAETDTSGFVFSKYLCSLRRTYPVLVYGEYLRVPTSNERDVFAFARIRTHECAIVVCNFRRKRSAVRIDLAGLGSTLTAEAAFTDAVSGERVLQQTGPRRSCSFVLPGFGWKLLIAEERR